MNNLRHRLSFPGLPLSKAALWIVTAGFLAGMFSYHHWTRTKNGERGVIKWDVISYYAYLPATFIYGDVGLGFLDKDRAPEGFVNDNKFWPVEPGDGTRVIQTTMGLAYLYSPFFFAAHALAPVFGEPRDGFGSIYQFFLALSPVVFAVLGLVALRRFLLRYFPDRPVALVLFLVGLGTNLFFYVVHDGPMTHAYNFALLIFFVEGVHRWYERPGFLRSALLGLLFGLIVLIRPTNLLAGLLLVGWKVSGWGELKERVRFLLGRFPQLGILALCFLLPWIPQFLYWKSVTGSLLFNSYGPGGSSFYFGAPHILDLLFSFRSGWYLYTPVMAVATLGLVFLWKKNRGLALPLALYLAAEIYVLASWWSWWNGGSFGIRSFVDIYGLMALPLAALAEKVLAVRPKSLRTGLLAGLVFLVYMNQLQTIQYTRGTIHYNGMTRQAYVLNFLRWRPDGRSWSMLELPDPQLARLGIYVGYSTGGIYEELKRMSPEEGLESVRTDLHADDRLSRQIRRHAARTGITEADAFEQVAVRVYAQRMNS